MSGVPSECLEGSKISRQDHVLLRGMYFGLCRTDRPPTAEEMGSPPRFIGNIAKLHATLNDKYLDVWEFSKADYDPDTNCSVRVTPSALKDPIDSSNQTGAARTKTRANSEEDMNDLYLFLELVTTVRVPCEVRAHRGNANLKNDIDVNNSRVGSIERGNEKRTKEVRGGKINAKSEGPSSADSEELVTADLCSGWVMVSVEKALKESRMTVKMLGGSPFGPPVQINQKELGTRPGFFEPLKRVVR